MKEKILNKLNELEAEHGFRILYACESGSRAWGFASADSDYDVRFLYAWPTEKYLSVYEPTDQMDWEIDADELDFSAWEIRKALGLFRKSNGSLMEWLHSPIVYREDPEVMARWRKLATECFVPKNSAAHYLGLSKGMWLRMQEAGATVTAKKYLYVLRSMLAARFVVENQSPVPVEFEKLRGALELPGEVTTAIMKMVEAKSHGNESDVIGGVPVLSQFVESELQRLAELSSDLPDQLCDIVLLDEFFRSVIGVSIQEG